MEILDNKEISKLLKDSRIINKWGENALSDLNLNDDYVKTILNKIIENGEGIFKTKSDRNKAKKLKENMEKERLNDMPEYRKLKITLSQDDFLSDLHKLYKEKLNKEINLENEDDLFSLGESYYEKEEYKKAIKIFLKLVKLYPNNARNWHWLGCLYCDNKQYKEAIKYLKKAIELEPKDYINYSWLGEVYNKIGRYKKSIEFLLKAIELSPKDRISLHYLASSYALDKQYEEAIKYLLELVELKSDSGNDWAGLGICYNETGKYQEAIECLLKAIELKANSFHDCWYFLGHSYYKNGEYKKAKNSLLQAMELNPINKYKKEIENILKDIDFHTFKN